MKNKIFAIIILFSCGIVKAQNFVSSEHCYLSEFIFNPAIAGKDIDPVAIISVKKNWTGINESPTTCMLNAYSNVAALRFSGSKKFMKKAANVGIGLGFYNDINGPMRTTGFQMAYSYHVLLKKYLKLSMGLAAKFMFYNLNQQHLKYLDPDDPLVTADFDNRYITNFNFGMMLCHPRYHVGLSCTNLGDFNNVGKGFYYEENIRTLYLTGAYKFGIGNSFLEPAVLLRNLKKDFKFDMSFKYGYKNYFWTSLGYGSPDFYIITVAVNVKQFTVGYAFEYSSAPLYKYGYGNHLVFVGYNFSGRLADNSSYPMNN